MPLSWGPQSSSSSSSDALTRALAGDTTAQASARSAASASPGWAQCSAFPSPPTPGLSVLQCQKHWGGRCRKSSRVFTFRDTGEMRDPRAGCPEPRGLPCAEEKLKWLLGTAQPNLPSLCKDCLLVGQPEPNPETHPLERAPSTQLPAGNGLSPV